jgi:thiosulfate dehydrogenase
MKRAIIYFGGPILVAAIAGFGVGYAIWGQRPDWYRGHDVWRLPPGLQSDLIRYGWQLIVETPRHIGKSGVDAAKRYAGNDLACTNCHMDAGLRSFAAPLVSTFASYPAMTNDQVITLAERINGCMTRSMNGSPMPENGREMEALIAYIEFVGRGTPVGVRVEGMGLRSLRRPELPPDGARGNTVYRDHCAGCHGPQGEGELRIDAIGYAIPPLWGSNSFNAAAGMNKLETAAAFIHANMPIGADYRSPVLTEQQAWDVATYMTTQPRPLQQRKDTAAN